jgi:hypothetical protein
MYYRRGVSGNYEAYSSAEHDAEGYGVAEEEGPERGHE